MEAAGGEAALPGAVQEACTAVCSNAERLLRPLLSPESQSSVLPTRSAITGFTSNFRVITDYFHISHPEGTPAEVEAAERTADALLSRPAFRQALHLTLSVAARWPIPVAEPAQAEPAADPPGDLDSDLSDLNCSACSTLAWIVTVCSDARDPRAIEVCRRLLRAQTLHALAGRLADLTSHLRRHAGPSAPAPLPEWVSLLLLQPASYLLRIVPTLVIALLKLADAVSKAADSGPQDGRPGAAAEGSGASGASRGPGASGGRGGVKDEGAGGSRGPAASPAAEGPAAQAGAQVGAEAKAAAELAGAERCFVQELSRALRESCVVEHCSATLLALLEAWGRTREAAAFLQPEAEPQVQGRTRAHVDRALTEVAVLHSIYAQRQGPASAPALRPPLGPCSSYAVLAHGLAVLACLDGGPTHGLRQELAPALIAQALPGLEWMQLEGFRVAAVPPDVTSLDLSPAARTSCINLTRQLPYTVVPVLVPSPASAKASAAGSTDPARVPGSRALLRPQNAARLAARVARLALAGLESRGREVQGEGGGVPEGTVRLAVAAGGRCSVLVTPGWAEEAAVTALAAAARIAKAAGEGPSSPPLLDAAWWRLVAEAALHVRGMQLSETVGAELLGQVPELPYTTEPLPPSPPPALAAALEGGVLPCLERLIRRAASDPGGWEEATMVEFVYSRGASGNTAWLRALLAYGNVRQASALVRTIGKAAQGIGPVRPKPSIIAALVSDAAQFVKSGRSWLDSLSERCGNSSGSGGGSSRGGGGSGSGGGGAALTAPERQLVGMLAAAVASWLPRAVISGQQQVAVAAWLPVLYQKFEPEPSAGVGRGAGARGGGSGGGSWRRFAVSELAGCDTLGSVMLMQDEPTYQKYQDSRHCRWILEGCLALAAAWPDPAPAWDLMTPRVRALAPKLRAAGHPKEAGAAEALAAQLVRWTRGAGARGAGRGGGGRAPSPALASYLREWSPRLEAAAALLPPSPAAALQALGGCSNPACANLEGDSEAGLALRACAGCGGAASYCRRECQVAHWRAGHKEACGVRG
ncbi:hypothetical protein HYH03_012846 [Edaphochlamys debaryana]|uniref:MYND-type domain-containing protein n=1 Tax=Edaphochlamys debaryana TaxID=47281 RepID=A0A835XUH9_9CHLO|nr:hypothetical protein HYH03_012846 [Edaphochlamys debaryana]|eukprot:KAG2488526.1 hypothetical protein HYH03_012846 [Edaphochlamys debaryana]